MQGSRITVNWEKSDIQLFTRVQYLRLLVDKCLEKVFPSEAHLARFQAVATFFLLPLPHSEHVAAGVGPYIFAGAFSSSRSRTHSSLAVALQGSLVPHGG